MCTHADLGMLASLVVFSQSVCSVSHCDTCVTCYLSSLWPVCVCMVCTCAYIRVHAYFATSILQCVWQCSTQLFVCRFFSVCGSAAHNCSCVDSSVCVAVQRTTLFVCQPSVCVAVPLFYTQYNKPRLWSGHWVSIAYHCILQIQLHLSKSAVMQTVALQLFLVQKHTM